MELTDEDLQRERDEVLGSTVESIRTLAPYVEAATASGTICAIGGESKIDAAKDNFKEILSRF